MEWRDGDLSALFRVFLCSDVVTSVVVVWMCRVVYLVHFMAKGVKRFLLLSEQGLFLESAIAALTGLFHSTPNTLHKAAAQRNIQSLI